MCPSQQNNNLQFSLGDRPIATRSRDLFYSGDKDACVGLEIRGRSEPFVSVCESVI